MKKFPVLLGLVLSLVLMLLAVPTQYAWACTPPPGGLPHYTTADHVKAAPVVLEGVVSYTAFLNYNVTATVQVVQYLKGSGPAQVEISGFGDSSVCLSSVEDGVHVIFLATGDPASGKLQAFYLSQFDAILPADAQTVNEVVAAAGQDPVVIAPLETVLTQAAVTPQPELDATSLVATANALAGNPAATTPAPALDLTAAWATLDASASQVANVSNAAPPTPSPVPAPAATSTEVMSLIGIGVVIGLILGVVIGVVGGLFMNRWRE